MFVDIDRDQHGLHNRGGGEHKITDQPGRIYTGHGLREHRVEKCRHPLPGLHNDRKLLPDPVLVWKKGCSNPVWKRLLAL